MKEKIGSIMKFIFRYIKRIIIAFAILCCILPIILLIQNLIVNRDTEGMLIFGFYSISALVTVFLFFLLVKKVRRKL